MAVGKKWDNLRDVPAKTYPYLDYYSITVTIRLLHLGFTVKLQDF